MPNLKEILFQQYAAVSREKVLKEFQQEYEPKKGGRFHQGGITYEVSPLEIEGKGLQFEISSKIPKDQLNERMSREQYFAAVKKLAKVKGKPLIYVGMDDIIHKVGDREIKKRDYIRLKYHYEYAELYDDQAVAAEAQAIQKGKSKLVVPAISGVQSLCGRLALLRSGESMYVHIKECMQALVSANEKVRQKLSSPKP